jgi:hypothetical protein
MTRVENDKRVVSRRFDFDHRLEQGEKLYIKFS